eukprot:TRINITY_DN302_c0_g1_i1.p1 TRINITY_DN302_c0_g1~~TRINITY_DN302_c0_g1_i1.p1  ORF type:complete len:1597 (-),score=230.07 TRINITY_DN302_c0_g1_i1:2739-7529(-)
MVRLLRSLGVALPVLICLLYTCHAEVMIYGAPAIQLNSTCSWRITVRIAFSRPSNDTNHAANTSIIVNSSDAPGAFAQWSVEDPTINGLGAGASLCGPPSGSAPGDFIQCIVPAASLEPTFSVYFISVPNLPSDSLLWFHVQHGTDITSPLVDPVSVAVPVVDTSADTVKHVPPVLVFGDPCFEPLRFVTGLTADSAVSNPRFQLLNGYSSPRGVEVALPNSSVWYPCPLTPHYLDANTFVHECNLSVVNITMYPVGSHELFEFRAWVAAGTTQLTGALLGDCAAPAEFTFTLNDTVSCTASSTATATQTPPGEYTAFVPPHFWLNATGGCSLTRILMVTVGTWGDFNATFPVLQVLQTSARAGFPVEIASSDTGPWFLCATSAPPILTAGTDAWECPLSSADIFHWPALSAPPFAGVDVFIRMVPLQNVSVHLMGGAEATQPGEIQLEPPNDPTCTPSPSSTVTLTFQNKLKFAPPHIVVPGEACTPRRIVFVAFAAEHEGATSPVVQILNGSSSSVEMALSVSGPFFPCTVGGVSVAPASGIDAAQWTCNVSSIGVSTWNNTEDGSGFYLALDAPPEELVLVAAHADNARAVFVSLTVPFISTCTSSSSSTLTASETMEIFIVHAPPHYMTNMSDGCVHRVVAMRFFAESDSLTGAFLQVLNSFPADTTIAASAHETGPFVACPTGHVPVVENYTSAYMCNLTDLGLPGWDLFPGTEIFVRVPSFRDAAVDLHVAAGATSAYPSVVALDMPVDPTCTLSTSATPSSTETTEVFTVFFPPHLFLNTSELCPLTRIMSVVFFTSHDTIGLPVFQFVDGLAPSAVVEVTLNESTGPWVTCTPNQPSIVPEFGGGPLCNLSAVGMSQWGVMPGTEVLLRVPSFSASTNITIAASQTGALPAVVEIEVPHDPSCTPSTPMSTSPSPSATLSPSGTSQIFTVFNPPHIFLPAPSCSTERIVAARFFVTGEPVWQPLLQVLNATAGGGVQVSRNSSGPWFTCPDAAPIYDDHPGGPTCNLSAIGVTTWGQDPGTVVFMSLSTEGLTDIVVAATAEGAVPVIAVLTVPQDPTCTVSPSATRTPSMTFSSTTENHAIFKPPHFFLEPTESCPEYRVMSAVFFVETSAENPWLQILNGSTSDDVSIGMNETGPWERCVRNSSNVAGFTDALNCDMSAVGVSDWNVAPGTRVYLRMPAFYSGASDITVAAGADSAYPAVVDLEVEVDLTCTASGTGTASGTPTTTLTLTDTAVIETVFKPPHVFLPSDVPCPEERVVAVRFYVTAGPVSDPVLQVLNGTVEGGRVSVGLNETGPFVDCAGGHDAMVEGWGNATHCNLTSLGDPTCTLSASASATATATESLTAENYVVFKPPHVFLASNESCPEYRVMSAVFYVKTSAENPWLQILNGSTSDDVSIGMNETGPWERCVRNSSNVAGFTDALNCDMSAVGVSDWNVAPGTRVYLRMPAFYSGASDITVAAGADSAYPAVVDLEVEVDLTCTASGTGTASGTPTTSWFVGVPWDRCLHPYSGVPTVRPFVDISCSRCDRCASYGCVACRPVRSDVFWFSVDVFVVFGFVVALVDVYSYADLNSGRSNGFQASPFVCR